MDKFTEAQAYEIDRLGGQLAKAYRAQRSADDLLTDALHAIANDRKDAAIDLVERALVHVKSIRS